jgi:hypothetical protein
MSCGVPLVGLLAAGILTAGEVRVGNGTYTTVTPRGAAVPSDTRNRAVRPSVTERVKGPIPTNDWWSSLVWKRP